LRRNNAIPSRCRNESRHAQGAWIDWHAGNPPLTPRRRVRAVPSGETLARDGCGERNAVIQPVFQGHEQFRPSVCGVPPAEAAVFVCNPPWIEHGEQRLQQVDR